MRVLAIVAVLGAAALPVGPAAAQPSFDCGLDMRLTERAICASPALAALDRELAAAYGRALDRAGPDERAALREGQRAWLRLRDACGATPACIAGLYRSRIDRIARLAGRAPADEDADEPEQAAQAEPAAAVALPARGRSTGGYARLTPAPDATPIALLRPDEEVTVLEAGGDGWFRIRYAGGWGYAPGGEICIRGGALDGTRGPCPR